MAGVCRVVRLGAQLVEQGAHGVDDLDVRLFVPVAHVVSFAQTPSLEQAADPAAVVFRIQPVKDLHAVSIDRQGFGAIGAQQVFGRDVARHLHLSLELVGSVEVLLLAALGATGNEDHLPNTRGISFFDRILDQRFVDHQQHSLVAGLGGR